MISEKYNCIFVHVPKAAGQSIENFFLDLHGLSWEQRAPLLLKYNPEPKAGPERLAHLKASEYTSFGYVKEAKFHDYFKFSFVRNPWARLVSEYRYRNYQKTMSFRKFVLKGLPEVNEYSDAYRHIMPQFDYLYDEHGKCLVDFIGRFERLQEDFDFVCSRLDIKNSKLSHVNSSAEGKKKKRTSGVFFFLQGPTKRHHYTEFYDRETKVAVENMYRKDIDTFNYSFES